MKKRLILLCCLFVIAYAGVTKPVHKARHGYRKINKVRVQYGLASFYDNKFIGRKTASGNKYSQMRLTAAHNHVPLGTWLRITNVKNKKNVIVRVTDRLHRKNTRIVDLSRSAATELGTPARGLLKVKVEILGRSRPLARQSEAG